MPVESNQTTQFQQNGHSHPPLLAPTASIAPSQQDELDLTQLARMIRRRVWLISGVAIAVTAAIWGWTLTRTPIYRGEFRVLVESVTATDRSQELLQKTDIQAGSSFDYATQIEVLRSPALLQPIVETLKKTYPDIRYDSLINSLAITRLGETKVLTIGYIDPDPQKIQAVLKEVSQNYLRYSFQQRQTSLQQGVQFVEDQLPELRKRVNTLQVELERFRQQYSLIDPQSRGSDLSELITGVEKQRQETETQLTEARSLYGVLQQQLGYNSDQALAASSLSESTRYQDILNQIRGVESQIAVESARFQPTSPNIQALEDKRKNLLPLLDQEAQRVLGDRPTDSVNGNLTATSLELNRQLVNAANQVQVLQTRREALAGVETRLKQEFSLVPALARQYTDMQRELTIATDSLNRFLSTRETLQIDAAQKSIPWELISGPTASPGPISPDVPRNLTLGAIAGLLLGSAAALFAEKLDTAFHSPEELKTVTKLPLLGVIPFVRELQETSVSADLLTLDAQVTTSSRNGMTPAAVQPKLSEQIFFEAFRSLYANLRFLSSDTSIRSLVISSATPSEGKSTTALHLAKAAAAMGMRVLLVDADLRCPQIHTRLGLQNLRGLSNIVTRDLPLHQVIQQAPLDKSLYVLTAGPIPPDPVKLLSSKRMQSLVKHFQAQFDLTIYDTPPLLGFADSSLLAPHTNGIMMVVGLGKTPRSDLIQALEALKISSVSILGVVANGMKAHTTQAYGYHRYHRYYTQTAQSSQVNLNLSSDALNGS